MAVIYVRVEMWPKGSRARRYLLGEALVENLTGGGPRADYRAVLSKKGGFKADEGRMARTDVKNVWREALVHGFPRSRSGFWHLLSRVLAMTAVLAAAAGCDREADWRKARWEEPCRDQSRLLATTAGSPDGRRWTSSSVTRWPGYAPSSTRPGPGPRAVEAFIGRVGDAELQECRERRRVDPGGPRLVRRRADRMGAGREDLAHALTAVRVSVLRWLYGLRLMPERLRRRVKRAYFDAWVKDMRRR